MKWTNLIPNLNRMFFVLKVIAQKNYLQIQNSKIRLIIQIKFLKIEKNIEMKRNIYNKFKKLYNRL